MQLNWSAATINVTHIKKNYRKIGKKNDNDMDANVAQLKRNNNKYYTSTIRDIYIYICKVEFNQSFCWLYSVTNLLVIQQLVTLYLGRNHVRVVCERV